MQEVSDHIDDYLKPKTWSYLKERIAISPTLQTSQGTFKISNSIRKPGHFFVWVLNTAKMGSQTQNMLVFKVTVDLLSKDYFVQKYVLNQVK